MAKALFRYVPFPISANSAHPQGTPAHRPIAIATITASNGNSVRWIVMPDSRADDCLFPMTLAIMLKLDVLQLPKAHTGGVGSQTNITYYDNLTVDMGGGIVFNTYAGFTQGMDSVGMGLLGQREFFESHVVEFRHFGKTLSVETL